MGPPNLDVAAARVCPPPAAPVSPALLSIQGLTVRFGGIVALDNVHFEVARGEICGLIGPNGAGKTTLFNCLSRLYRPQSGAIRFEGRAIERLAKHEIARLGIARTFQNLALFGTMTALENVMIGTHAIAQGGFLVNALALPNARREERRIRERALAWAVAAVDAATIDSINIYQASRQAMQMAASRLNPAPDFLLVDAVSLDLEVPQRALIKGDARCHAIAAASIIAKVWRDELMRVWDAVFPAYGLASHKGYSTPEHLRALREFGPTPLHRLSFEPVRAHARVPLDCDRQMELFETAAAV